MTRDELRENVRGSLFDEQYTDYVMANIDAYTSAVIAQSKCSTLRELIAQKLDWWVEADEDELNYIQRRNRTNMIKELSDILKSIDKLLPLLRTRK